MKCYIYDGECNKECDCYPCNYVKCYRDAIDEFVKKCKTTHDEIISNWNKPYAITFKGIEEIAEQLKED